MKRIYFSTLLLAMFSCAVGRASAGQLLYLASTQEKTIVAYVSNRDLTKRKEGEAPKDTLTGVSLDPETGKMKLIGYYPTAHFPRSICIDSTGNFICNRSR